MIMKLVMALIMVKLMAIIVVTVVVVLAVVVAAAAVAVAAAAVVVVAIVATVVVVTVVVVVVAAAAAPAAAVVVLHQDAAASLSVTTLRFQCGVAELCIHSLPFTFTTICLSVDSLLAVLLVSGINGYNHTCEHCRRHIVLSHSVFCVY